MERERERFTALGKGRERYGHDDGEVDSSVFLDLAQSFDEALFFKHGRSS